MEYISHLTDQIKFGPYPNKLILDYLRSNNFLILDLRSHKEHTPEYEYEYNPELKYNFYIEDRRVPSFEDLTNIVIFLHNYIYNRGKVYIHCRGGHGRAGLVAGALYGKAYNLSYDQIMLDLKKSHETRLGVDYRWLKMGIPQTSEQKNLLKLFLTN